MKRLDEKREVSRIDIKEERPGEALFSLFKFAKLRYARLIRSTEPRAP
jgi:hypothetical protein